MASLTGAPILESKVIMAATVVAAAVVEAKKGDRKWKAKEEVDDEMEEKKEENENLIPEVAVTTDEQRFIDYYSVEEKQKSRSPHNYRLVSRLVRGRGVSSCIVVGGVILFSLFLTGWYYDTRKVPGFFSLVSINGRIDPSLLSSSTTSSNSKILSSSQKQVGGVIEKRSNITIIEEKKRNHNQNDSDTTVDTDFDLSLSHYECGKFKCFIPSKSNQDIGYLVNLKTNLNPKTKQTAQPMPSMIGGWHLAQWIDEQFGVLPNGFHRHFYIDAPFIISLNEAVTTELCNIHLTNPDIKDQIETEKSKELEEIQDRKQKKKYKKKKYKVVSMKLENQSVVMDVIVQKVKKIEIDDFLFYKCRGPLNENFNQKKKEYINNVIKMGNGIEFYKNLKEGYHNLKTIIKLKPIISIDFHALFDTKGDMYFTDLDIKKFNKKLIKKGKKVA